MAGEDHASDEDYLRQAPDRPDDVGVDARDAADERERRRLRNDELRHAARYRAVFLVWGLSIVTVCVAASAVCVWALFRFGGYREMQGVIVAFIGSLAVEVVGIAAIIARYLFPEGGPRHSDGAKPE